MHLKPSNMSTRMSRSIPIALSGLGVVTPALALPARTLAANAKAKVTTKTYQATSSFPYGAVRVTISVANRRIKTLNVAYAPDTPRSAQLDAYALPILRSEALKASSYKVHSVAGVTFTSRAFQSTLYSAMLKAHL